MARIIFLTRGAPGSGKSTWIRESGLTDYTVSIDNLRLLRISPQLNDDGRFEVSQKMDTEVWKQAYEIIFNKMLNGDTIVVDACFSKETDFAEIRKMAEVNRYRIFVVDFTNVSLPELIKRNAARGINGVSTAILEKMVSRFLNQNPPKYCTVLKPEDAIRAVSPIVFNYDVYKKVHIFGDIQGCFAPLKEYFETNPYNKDDFYLFTGDLFDRGKENYEVAVFMKDMIQKPNVLLLASNHGTHFNRWAMDLDAHIKGKSFGATEREFILKGFTKEDARTITRKEGQFALFKRGEKVFFVCHGGLPGFDWGIDDKSSNLMALKANLPFISIRQLEKGVGGYGSVDACANTWNRLMPDNCYQVHGHRSEEGSPVQLGRVFRLEGSVEFNGFLHVLQIDEQNNTTVVSIKNGTATPRRWKEEDELGNTTDKSIAEISSVEDLVVLMRQRHKDIFERRDGHISSFNFKKHVFHDASWDEANIMARGFFVKTSGCEKPYTVARSYNKFFNIGERFDTRMDKLKNSLVYPVKAYKKENGFLGILGYDCEEDKLIFCSKSTINGDFSKYFENLFKKQFTDETAESIKHIIRTEKLCSLVFEVIDIENDPHIIEEEKSKLVLLDAFYPDINESRLSYDKLVQIGVFLGCPVKEESKVLNNFEEMEEFIASESETCVHEGYVFEDARGFKVKWKSPYYSTWKKLRGLRDRMKLGRDINLGWLNTPLENDFYGFLKRKIDGLSADERIVALDRSIIDLRKEFLRNAQRADELIKKWGFLLEPRDKN